MLWVWPSSLTRQYLIVALVNLVSFTTGINLIWSSPMLVKLEKDNEPPFYRPITSEEGSWIVSGGYLAAFGTNFLAGLLIDKIGRKYCIILVTIPRMFASIWTIFANEVWMLILCRAIMVLTDCYIFVVVPIYVSEIACKEHRGSLGAFLHIYSCIGIVVSYAAGPYLSYTALNVVLATATVVTALPIPLLPDSPVYLYSKGKKNEAIEILSKIRSSDEEVKQELEDYESSKEIKINKIALLKDRVFLKSLSLSVLICIGANMTGYSAVSFYLQPILVSTKTNIEPEIASVIVGVIQLLAAICSSIFNNLFGRRPLLIYSGIGVFFGMIGLGIFFTLNNKAEGDITGFLNYLPLISLVVSTYCFNIGIGCLIFIVTAELFEGTTRAIGVNLSFWVFLLITFLVSKYFSAMTVAMGVSETFWFFSAMCLLLVALIAIFLPETKGKTFNEIQIALGRSNVRTDFRKL